MSPEDNAAPKAEDSNPVLTWLAKHGPRWARIPAIIIALLVAALPILPLISSNVERLMYHSASDAVGDQLEMAATGELTGRSEILHGLLNRANLSDDARKAFAQQTAETDHELWHLNNRNDDVAWTVFEKVTKKDYIGYKLFPSDKCLLIARIENGLARTQWLKDPYQPAAQESPTGAASQPRPGLSEALKTHLAALSNPLQASLVLASDRHGSDLKLSRDQSQEAQGQCLNPHPWNYQETWGPYINQCQQPVFRQWNDGCRHVQMFDHCANAWGPIVWQVCVPYHHP